IESLCEQCLVELYDNRFNYYIRCQNGKTEYEITLFHESNRRFKWDEISESIKTLIELITQYYRVRHELIKSTHCMSDYHIKFYNREIPYTIEDVYELLDFQQQKGSYDFLSFSIVVAEK